MRPDNGNERALIKRAKKGDMDAFESLVRQYQQTIYHLCLRITGAHQTADDLSQDTFIKAYLALSHFIDGHDFFPWIRRIALNNCFNHLKKWKRERPLAEEEKVARPNFLSTPNESPPESVMREEMERKFKEAYKALPADQKIIFSLRAFENLSYREIAQALSIPTGTVMSRLNRARRKLKIQMADYLGGAR
jgi:RNA polymerase sigma-70 factor (ECF subfamily)